LSIMPAMKGPRTMHAKSAALFMYR
jgi:hypothetical protein